MTKERYGEFRQRGQSQRQNQPGRVHGCSNLASVVSFPMTPLSGSGTSGLGASHLPEFCLDPCAQPRVEAVLGPHMWQSAGAKAVRKHRSRRVALDTNGQPAGERIGENTPTERRLCEKCPPCSESVRSLTGSSSRRHVFRVRRCRLYHHKV